ncbi:MAG: transposase domain-containing protein [Pseudomonadota bacterium]
MTARANGLEPYRSLCRAFSELSKATSMEDMEALLPRGIG